MDPDRSIPTDDEADRDAFANAIAAVYRPVGRRREDLLQTLEQLRRSHLSNIRTGADAVERIRSSPIGHVDIDERPGDAPVDAGPSDFNTLLEEQTRWLERTTRDVLAGAERLNKELIERYLVGGPQVAPPSPEQP